MVSMELDGIEVRLKELLLSLADTGIDPADVQPGVALVKSGLSLNSVALLEFIVAIEAEYNLILDEGALTEENFASLRDLARAVANEIGKQRGA